MLLICWTKTKVEGLDSQRRLVTPRGLYLLESRKMRFLAAAVSRLLFQHHIVLPYFCCSISNWLGISGYASFLFQMILASIFFGFTLVDNS